MTLEPRPFGGGGFPMEMQMKDHFQKIVEAAVAYSKARDTLNAALTDFVRAHLKEGASKPFDLYAEAALSDILPLKKPCGPESVKVHFHKEPTKEPNGLTKQKPLGKVTRVVVRGLLAKCNEGEAFTTWDVESVREPPFNYAKNLHPSLMGLARRGLLTHVSPNVWVIPSRKALEASLSL